MTKAQLIKWSIARDVLDFFVIGQIPPFNWLFDLPILAMHFMYAGPRACVTALELIPVLGTFPLFTLAAMSYPNKDTPSQGGSANVTVSQAAVYRRPSPVPINGAQPALYAMVEGKLVPVMLPDGAESDIQLTAPDHQLPGQ